MSAYWKWNAVATKALRAVTPRL